MKHIIFVVPIGSRGPMGDQALKQYVLDILGPIGDIRMFDQYKEFKSKRGGESEDDVQKAFVSSLCQNSDCDILGAMQSSTSDLHILSTYSCFMSAENARFSFVFANENEARFISSATEVTFPAQRTEAQATAAEATSSAHSMGAQARSSEVDPAEVVVCILGHGMPVPPGTMVHRSPPPRGQGEQCCVSGEPNDLNTILEKAFTMVQSHIPQGAQVTMFFSGACFSQIGTPVSTAGRGQLQEGSVCFCIHQISQQLGISCQNIVGFDGVSFVHPTKPLAWECTREDYIPGNEPSKLNELPIVFRIQLMTLLKYHDKVQEVNEMCQSFIDQLVVSGSMNEFYMGSFLELVRDFGKIANSIYSEFVTESVKTDRLYLVDSAYQALETVHGVQRRQPSWTSEESNDTSQKQQQGSSDTSPVPPEDGDLQQSGEQQRSLPFQFPKDDGL